MGDSSKAQAPINPSLSVGREDMETSIPSADRTEVGRRWAFWLGGGSHSARLGPETAFLPPLFLRKGLR